MKKTVRPRSLPRASRGVFHFFIRTKAEGKGDNKILGNKGAGLHEMARLSLPIPPGFIISTEACKIFYENGERFPATLNSQMRLYLARLEEALGKRFGEANNPLLVSVRSGAPVSMPGMMDTILNVGLNDKVVDGFGKITGRRFAYDCYRRLIVMFASTVNRIDKALFEKILAELKMSRSVKHENELSEETFIWLVERYKQIYKKETGKDFPQNPYTQLELARDAVFRSWNNKRAAEYRRIYHISHDIGTAVIVQAMVFGNLPQNSGTGVGFTRDPATGENFLYGEFLPYAQGEDIVAGSRTPVHLDTLKDFSPPAYKSLQIMTRKLERHYKDVQDFEFTVESGKLYMLQTRSAKRSAQAALKIAIEMLDEGLITEKQAVLRVNCEHMQNILHPVFDPEVKPKFKLFTKGLNASPGAASGRVTFNPDEAVKLADKGERVILVRAQTSADDVYAMAKSKGIMTTAGGFTSHAAVVARQMGRPSIVGCEDVKIDESTRCMKKDTLKITEGDYISIDGSSGEVLIGDVPLQEPQIIRVLKGEIKPDKSQLYNYYNRFMRITDKYRRLGVRANADTPEDARLAIIFGAEGIGLCRTEHMFFASDRLPIMRELIMAQTEEQIKLALEKLLPLQIVDFIQIFRIMKDKPVTIRTLDPPLHEFLPSREELIAKIERLKAAGDRGKRYADLNKILQRVNELHEFNPMLGHRGCRLGITMPQITQMQAKAILTAAINIKKEVGKVTPEIMIPVVSDVRELTDQISIINSTATELQRKIKYSVGTMIEVPRAALTADEIAKKADFFSFGTNDLTQMTFGFSRDDSRKFLGDYISKNILIADPFMTLDRSGVGSLMQIACQQGRSVRKDLKIGICGEHGGDEMSIKFCHKIGLDYVSCSPYRIPVAKLAAAQAAIIKES